MPPTLGSEQREGRSVAILLWWSVGAVLLGRHPHLAFHDEWPREGLPAMEHWDVRMVVSFPDVFPNDANDLERNKMRARVEAAGASLEPGDDLELWFRRRVSGRSPEEASAFAKQEIEELVRAVVQKPEQWPVQVVAVLPVSGG